MKRLRFTLTAAAFAVLLLAWWATRPKPAPESAPPADAGADTEVHAPPAPASVSAAPAPESATGEEGAEESAATDAEPLRLSVDRWGKVRLGDEAIERDALRRRLVAWADGSRDPDDRVHASNREIVLLVDPAAEWGPAQQTLQLCADPEIRIWRIDLRIGGTFHRLALDRAGMAEERRITLDGPVELTIRIRPVDGGLDYRLLDRDLGRNDTGRTALAERLKRIVAANDETLIPEIEAAPDVRASEVAEVLAFCEAAGLPPARIEGAPPPYPKPFLATPRTLEKEDR